MNFFNVHITPEAVTRATAVLRSGWVSEGDVVREFERELERQLGLRNVVATNSGTSALHLALAVAGIGSKDEVILPAQTFIASGLAILMAGATPVFADIDPLTGNICPASITEKVTRKTKAIMPVHWAGYPCDLEAIGDIAWARDLAVIEDAAHALGAKYQEFSIGDVSRFTAFSFQAVKHLTTGDGGALCCRRLADIHKARALRWFGIERGTSEPSILGERVYDLDTLGYKYHMNNVAAAIGLGNLAGFKQRLCCRFAHAAHYCHELQGAPGLQLLNYDDHSLSAYWLFPVLVEGRKDFIRKLKGHGIPTSVVHQRIDKYSIFGGPYDLPGQAIFDEKQISLPVHDGLGAEDIAYICDVIKEGW